MLRGLFMVSGILLLKLMYGKNRANEAKEKIGLGIFLSLLNIFWMLCVMFLIMGIAAKDTWICIIFSIGYPILIIAITITIRRNAVDGSCEQDTEGANDNNPEIITDLTDTTIREMAEPSNTTVNINNNSISDKVLATNETNNSEDENIENLPIKFCRKCGKEVLPGALFCNKCGEKVIID